VQETLDWFRTAREVKQVNLAIAVPYPGTKFHEMAVCGSHGLVLTTTDFPKYRRYGSAVTKVNGLDSKGLVALQNRSFVDIYSAWWRWIPMFNKHGVLGVLLMLMRLGLVLIQSKEYLLCQLHPIQARSGPKASLCLVGSLNNTISFSLATDDHRVLNAEKVHQAAVFFPTPIVNTYCAIG